MYYIIRSLDENVENFIIFDYSKFIHLLKTAWAKMETKSHFDTMIQLSLKRSSTSYQVAEKYSEEFLALFQPQTILDVQHGASFKECLVSDGSAISLETEVFPQHLVDTRIPLNQVIVNGLGVNNYSLQKPCSTDDKKVLGLSFNGRYKIKIKTKDDDERCL